MKALAPHDAALVLAAAFLLTACAAPFHPTPTHGPHPDDSASAPVEPPPFPVIPPPPEPVPAQW